MVFLEETNIAMKTNPIFCALDTTDLVRATQLADQLRGYVYGLKIGLEFFMAHGAIGYKALAACGLPVFLDVKLHDIPNTVAGALTSLLALQPNFITLHASGGEDMMRAALRTTHDLSVKTGQSAPYLLGVTVLTSLDTDDLAAIGQNIPVSEQVRCLARLSQKSGLHGVICSPEEIKSLRTACGPSFILMVPGIRPEGFDLQDQKRVMTPRQAMDAGANYLVIGRPITSHANPAEAAQRILDSL